tara:strand:- start:252 stop:521 length:270 start_codon:yes stop_codon:yes gene_type:complete
MDQQSRDKFWKAIEDGSDPLLSVLHTLVERWGLPAIVMSLGDISEVLSEDALDADNLTPNQRGLIMGACAQVCQLKDQMRAEMDFIAKH